MFKTNACPINRCFSDNCNFDKRYEKQCNDMTANLEMNYDTSSDNTPLYSAKNNIYPAVNSSLRKNKIPLGKTSGTFEQFKLDTKGGVRESLKGNRPKRSKPAKNNHRRQERRNRNNQRSNNHNKPESDTRNNNSNINNNVRRNNNDNNQTYYHRWEESVMSNHNNRNNQQRRNNGQNYSDPKKKIRDRNEARTQHHHHNERNENVPKRDGQKRRDQNRNKEYNMKENMSLSHPKNFNYCQDNSFGRNQPYPRSYPQDKIPVVYNNGDLTTSRRIESNYTENFKNNNMNKGGLASAYNDMLTIGKNIKDEINKRGKALRHNRHENFADINAVQNSDMFEEEVHTPPKPLTTTKNNILFNFFKQNKLFNKYTTTIIILSSIICYMVLYFFVFTFFIDPGYKTTKTTIIIPNKDGNLSDIMVDQVHGIDNYKKSKESFYKVN